MSLVRRLARPLLSAMFLAQGVQQFRNPGPKVAAARPLVELVHEPLRLPNDPELLVKANGAVMAGAGTLLATNHLPRLSSGVLAASLAASTYTSHAFWQQSDPTLRAEQQTQFLKNLGVLGGLLVSTVDTGGRPGLLWRSRRATRDAKRFAGTAKRDASRTATLARRDARRAAGLARKEAAAATFGARREVKLAKARVGRLGSR